MKNRTIWYINLNKTPWHWYIYICIIWIRYIYIRTYIYIYTWKYCFKERVGHVGQYIQRRFPQYGKMWCDSQTLICNASGSIQLLSLNNLPSLKLIWHLKMDGWNTSFLLGWMKFSWAMFVSGRVPWSISKIFKPRMPCLELASYIRTPFRDRWKGLSQSCQANSFDKKQVTNNFFQVIQSDPF